MEQRIYHGKLTPDGVAQAIIARFNQGNLRAQQLGSGEQVVVQIRTRAGSTSGGQTALTVTLQRHEDGVTAQIGKQAWMGVAASLGISTLSAFRNPFSLIGRLDDIAQDIENLQLSERVWETVENYCRAIGATHELSDRLRRLVCIYCQTANPVGEPSCLACGAPLGQVQPSTCANCGYVLKFGETICPNCKKPVR